MRKPVGFRPFEEILVGFRQCHIPELNTYLEQFEQNTNEAGLRRFFVELLSMSDLRKQNALDQLVTYASLNQQQPTCQLIIELAEQYPNDVGLFAPLLLNVITLKPGEAMFLNARTPHAYIKGTGLEQAYGCGRVGEMHRFCLQASRELTHPRARCGM